MKISLRLNKRCGSGEFLNIKIHKSEKIKEKVYASNIKLNTDDMQVFKTQTRGKSV